MKKKSLLSLFAICIPLFSESPNEFYSQYRQTPPQTKPMTTRQEVASSTREITPNAGPKVSHGADVFFTADFLYWTSREDGMGFAYNGAVAGVGPASQNVGKGSVKHVDWDWDPGFKVGVGFNVDHDGWDVYAQYTWLRSNPSRRATSISDASIFAIKPLWNIAGSGDDDLLFASGSWEHRLNIIDVELGRNYYLSRFLTSRPHIGLRGSWQEDDFSVVYENSMAERFRMKNNQDYLGVGIRFGADNAFYFLKNFCLYGNLALSALWSRFEIHRKDFFTNTSNETFVNLNLSNDFHSLKAVLELSLGLRYDVWWSNDDYHFGISAGWEEQVWFSHNQHFRVTEESAHGDLYFQGLTLKARFDF